VFDSENVVNGEKVRAFSGVKLAENHQNYLKIEREIFKNPKIVAFSPSKYFLVTPSATEQHCGLQYQSDCHQMFLDFVFRDFFLTRRHFYFEL
jgi:hypothetical protein